MRNNIAKKQAEIYYEKARQIKQSNKNATDKAGDLRRCLESLFSLLSKPYHPLSKKVYEQMTLVFDNEQVDRSIVDGSHQLRMALNQVIHNNSGTVVNFDGTIYDFVRIVHFFSSVPIPKDLDLSNPKDNKKEKESVEELIDDLYDYPNPRVPVALVLDISGSMEGPPIQQLNESVIKFFDALEGDPIAKFSAEVCIITFNSAVTLHRNFDLPMHHKPKPFKASGLTSMGQALLTAVSLLEERKNNYKDAGVEYYQPWMVLITDGEPTDSIDIAEKSIRTLVRDKKLTMLAVGVSSANFSILSKLSSTPLKLKGLEFEKFFQWLGKSIEKISHSSPDETVTLPDVSEWAES